MTTNDEQLICVPQFNFISNLFYLFTYLFILTQICTERPVNMCAMFWENVLTGF